jgi:hypothetical protein
LWNSPQQSITENVLGILSLPGNPARQLSITRKFVQLTLSPREKEGEEEVAEENEPRIDEDFGPSSCFLLSSTLSGGGRGEVELEPRFGSSSPSSRAKKASHFSTNLTMR